MHKLHFFLTQGFSWLVQPVHAQISNCPLGGGWSCAVDPVAYLSSTIITPAAIAFGGLLGAMLVVYTLKLVLGAREEAQITEVKQAYGHAMLGAVLVAAAQFIANSFTTGGTVNAVNLEVTVIDRIIQFGLALVSTLLVINLVVQGARLILAQDQGQIDNARKQILRGFFATAAALLAFPVVQGFGIPFGGATGVAAEFVGVANYLITIFGGLAVVAFVVAGIMIILSANEQLKDNARKLIIASSVAIVAVIVARAIVSLFL